MNRRLTLTNLLQSLKKRVYHSIVFKTFLVIVAALFVNSSQILAQTQLIPTADGGFENGTSTFAANGWTDVQPGNTRQWQVGTAAGANNGTKAAYAGSPSNDNGSNNSSVQHFYRDVIIPAAVTNVQFSFYLQYPNRDNGNDYLYVYRTTTANTPVSGTVPGAGYTLLYSNTNTRYNSFNLINGLDLTALAGTTVRLVFTYRSNGSGTHANPAIDDVSLTYMPPAPVVNSFSPSDGCANSGIITINGTNLSSASAVTIGGTAVSSITSNTATQIVAVVGSGTTGSVRVTTASGADNGPGSFTVNAAPNAYNVGGGGTYCSTGSGVNVTLSGSQLLYSYQLYNGASPVGSPVIGLGVAINFGLQTAAGTYTVIATNNGTGCTRTQNGSASIIINTAPNISVSPASQSKCIGQAVTFNVTATGTSLSYQWRKNGANIGGAMSSTYTIPAIIAGDAANYDVVVSVTTCASVTSSVATLTVLSLPIAYNVTGGGTYCSTGSGLPVGLSNSQASTNYQLYLGASPVGLPVAGTGAAISFGLQTAAGTYTVIGTSIVGSCDRTQNGSVVIIINTAPSITVHPVSQAKCVGQPLTLSVTAAGTSRTFQWRKNGVNIGGATSSTYNIASFALTDAADYDVVVSVVTCSSVTSTIATLTVSPLPTIYNVTGGGIGCSSVAVGLSSSQSGVNYTLSPGAIIVPGTGSAISFGGQTVSATYTVSATNASTGCSAAMTGNAIVTISSAPTITTQPSDQSACVGSSVSFTVAATGAGLSYQWKRGTTNLVNGGSISGVNTATLTVNPATLANGGSDYNCEVTNVCGNDISDYVSLTLGATAVTPSAQPTAISFPTIGVSSFISTFSASASAGYYLVVRRNTNVAPSSPVNGTTYPIGSAALGAGTFVEQSSNDSSFSSNGLNQGTTYYYWVYGYNMGVCGSSPVYLAASPLTGSATTLTNVVCGSNPTLYWAGTSSYFTNGAATNNFNLASNWSTDAATYIASASVPSACTSVDLRTGNGSVYVTINLNANSAVYNLNFTAENGIDGFIHTNGYTLTVNGNANIDVRSGNFTYVGIGEHSATGAGIVDFKANVTIGTNAATSGSGKRSYFFGSPNSKIIFRGDLLLGRTHVITSTYRPGTMEFDGIGLQEVLWNNDLYFANFNNVVVGNINNPICRHVTGTYTPDNILGNLTVNGSSTLDLATSQWIRDAVGGTFSLNNTAKLVLGNNKSIVSPSSGLGVLIPGSNFPGFSTISLASGSTVEYDGDNAITQTIYSGATYGNLILTNSSGTGIANRISTGIVTVSGSSQVKSGVTFTPGAGVVTNGAFSVNGGATLVCASNVVSGSGSFNLNAGGIISIGSNQGIMATGATGNITSTTRNFSTGANYIYLSSGSTNTGTGLPTTVNDLTISNSSGVTLFGASSNYTVNGTLRLTIGSFVINGNTLSVNNLVRTSGSLRGSATSSLTINGSSAPIYLTAGGRIIKNFTLGNGASGTLLTDMEIPGGSNAGSVNIGSAATLTTNSRLILRSTATGSARIAEIPVDGSGNALGFVSGNVQVERYISARKAWRLISVTTSGAQTINGAWQEGQSANVTTPAGYGIHITGPYYPNGFDLYSVTPSVKTYAAGTSTWTSISGTNIPFAAGTAYMTFVRGDRTVNGFTQPPTATILRTRGSLITGNQAPITVNADKFEVINNPYASSIDFKKVLRSGVDDKFYVWDPYLGTLGGYQTFIKNGSGDYEVVLGGGSYGTAGDVFNEIQNGVAFMVFATGSAGTLTLQENDKSAGNLGVSRVNQENTGSQRKQLRTKLYGVAADGVATLVDGVLNQFDDIYSNIVDADDALKGNSFGENLSINNAGKLLVVDRKHTIVDSDTIFFNLASTRAQQYKFSFKPEGMNTEGLTAYFEDSYLNTSSPISLTDTSAVTFSIANIPGSYAVNRFRIVFKQVAAPAFTSINATRNISNGPVIVSFTVARESAIQHYEVERSGNGVDFQNIMIIDPIGNNCGTFNYTAIDQLPLRGINYYRIKGLKQNGADLYSAIFKLSPGKDLIAGKQAYEFISTEVVANKESSVTVYPNPVVEKLMHIRFVNQPAGVYNLALINNMGQVIFTKTLQLSADTKVESVSIGEKVTAGNYYLKLTNDTGKVLTIKVLIK